MLSEGIIIICIAWKRERGSKWDWNEWTIDWKEKQLTPFQCHQNCGMPYLSTQSQPDNRLCIKGNTWQLIESMWCRSVFYQPQAHSFCCPEIAQFRSCWWNNQQLRHHKHNFALFSSSLARQLPRWLLSLITTLSPFCMLLFCSNICCLLQLRPIMWRPNVHF